MGDGTNIDKNELIQIGSDKDWIAIAAGEGFSLAMKSNGALWAWGKNYSGQLGFGTINKNIPMTKKFGAFNDWMFIACGNKHSIGIREDNTLWTWGDNSYGQLGYGYNGGKVNTPIQVDIDNEWISIAGGGHHTVGIKLDSTLWAWGANGSGQLGDGTYVNKNIPTKIGLDKDWISISAGENFTIALKSDSTLWGIWGYQPVQVGTDRDWIKISAGRSYILSLKSDSTLWAFGWNDKGQLGDGTFENKNNPTKIEDDKLPAVSTTTPSNKAIEVPVDTVITVKFSEPMNASSINSSTFTIVGAGLAPAQIEGKIIYADSTATFIPLSNLAINSVYTVTLTNNIKDIAGNRLEQYSWYFNSPDTISPQVVSIIPANGSSEIPISSKLVITFSEPINKTTINMNTFYLSNGRDIISGKINYDNELTATFTPLRELQQNTEYTIKITNGIKDISGNSLNMEYTYKFTTVKEIWTEIFSSGGNYTVGLRSDGTLWAWGRNNYGQLGDGTTINKSIPTYIDADTTWIAIACGNEHTIGLINNGTLWAWGRNNFGQLGDSTTINRFTPSKIGTDSNWEAIACGDNHSLGLRADNTLWAWGRNIYGQLGNGTNVDKITPTQIGADNTWFAIACGSEYTIGLKNDSTLWAWGRNAYGQLGNGTNIDKTIPTQIGMDTTWIAMACGKEHTIGLKNDSTLWAWGRNNYGQLGNGTNIDKAMPIQIGMDTTWVAIACGDNHSLGLKADGTLWTWGNNGNGQLGDGTNIDINSPTQIGHNTTWVKIRAGDNYTIALDNHTILWAWGQNNYGQIGDNTNTDKNVITNVGDDIVSPQVISIVPQSGAQNVPFNSNITVTFSENLDPSSINGNTFKIVGAGLAPAQIEGTVTYNNKTAVFYPTEYLDFNSMYFVSITTGVKDIAGNSMMLNYTSRFDTQVYDVTPKIISTNPLNEAQNVSINTNISIKFSEIMKSDSINSNTFYLNNGSIAGAITYNPDDTTFIFTPSLPLELNTLHTVTVNKQIVDTLKIPMHEDYIFTFITEAPPLWNDIACGENHTVGIKNDGTLWTWGKNSSGQLGDGTFEDKNIPTQIGSDNDWSRVSCGSSHTIAIKSNGTLWAWGKNSSGQLGDGTFEDKNIPTRIGNDNDWLSISAGWLYTIGIKNDGTLLAWGSNYYGQLGDGTNIDKNIPIQINTDKDWAKVICGSGHTIGIRNDGTLWAWGNNNYGQLGDGTNESRNTPVQIGYYNNWNRISCGKYHTIGIKNNGTLWAWGNNYYGQLGDATNVDKNEPIEIGFNNYNYHYWISAVCGSNHTIGISNFGTLWAWGRNNFGQLGYGLNVDYNRNIPDEIGINNDWLFIKAGDNFSICIRRNGSVLVWGSNYYGELGDGTNENKNTPVTLGD
ncbi:Ig-like domain-containing protein [Candidatus Poribacteria bacterium]|nr:Ig-like domain-containing protein [Candidatus Poribacteria bacterium]